MHDGVDFVQVREAAEEGRLAGYLEANIPRWRWPAVRSPNGLSLLQYAASGGDEVAVVALVRAGLDVNAFDRGDRTACLNAAWSGRVDALRALIVAGAAVNVRAHSYAPVDRALLEGHHECVRVLIVNGAQLAPVYANIPPLIEPWMRALATGRARCKAAVVALMGIKRWRADSMWRGLDRFLVRAMVLEVWSTRAEGVWQPPLADFAPAPPTGVVSAPSRGGCIAQ